VIEGLVRTMQQCYFIQVCNPSSYLITQHTIEIYNVTSILEGYYDIDHRPRKKFKIDAQAVFLALLPRREKRPINEW